MSKDKCPSCGGSGYIGDKNAGSKCWCQTKPKASEFTKKVRKIWRKNEVHGGIIYKLCTLLDQANVQIESQAREIEKFKKGVKHIKKWCGLNMGGMTVEGITRALIRMCNDVEQAAGRKG